MSARKTSNNLVWVVLVAVAGALAYGIGPGAWFRATDANVVRGARVQRGPLRISVVQRGNLAAKDSLSVKSEIEGQTTVLYLIPEGTMVKPGDLLVELDQADLVEKRVGQSISVQNADAAYTKAKAAYEIQVSQNKSDIELAERKLTFAKIDQDKYLKGDLEQLVKEAEDKILLAQQALTQAENTLNWSKSLAEKGFLTKSELDRDDLDYQSAKVQFEQAKVAKDLLLEFDDPRTRTELEADLREAERGLEREKLKATAMLADFEAALKSSEAKLELEREKLTKYLDQIKKTRVASTVSGMVVYTRGEGGRMGMGEPIQEGSQVRERQEILTIPRTGGMIVEASLHESVLKQVAVGLPCTVQIDAMPGQEFRGQVQFVALLPDKGSWWMNPNTRLYRTEISISETHPEMRPGMSCNIEILTVEIQDTLYAPLQAVLLDKGETIAFVVEPEGVATRKVKVGRNNDKWVEILEGLREGDEVLLSPPANFLPQEGKNGRGATGTKDGEPKGRNAGDADLSSPSNGAGRDAPGAPPAAAGMPSDGNVPAGAGMNAADGPARDGGGRGMPGAGMPGGREGDRDPSAMRRGGQRRDAGDGGRSAPVEKTPGGGTTTEPAGGAAESSGDGAETPRER